MDPNFASIINGILNLHGYDEKRTAMIMESLLKENIYGINMIDERLIPVIGPLIVRLLCPVASDLAFPQLKTYGEVTTKDWVKKLLKKLAWPKEDIQIGCRELKLKGIVKMKSIGWLTKKDWNDLAISPHLRVAIEQAIMDTNMASRSQIERCIVTDELGVAYEIDRYCPHKGADLSKV